MEDTPASKRIRLSSQPVITINDLPDELIVKIVKHLNGSGLLSFSGTCTRFFRISQTSSYHLNFENSHENGLLSISETTACLFNNFLNHHLNPYLLKSVNLNGVYWVEPDILEKFLIQCKQVEKLEVAETNLSTERIVAHILPHCPSVTSLSFSMDRSIELHRNGPVLLQGGPALSKLLSVEIIMKRDEDSSYRNLVEFLMKCNNLEEVVVSGGPNYLSNTTNEADVLPGTNKLKSFIYVAYPLDHDELPRTYYTTLFNQQRQMSTFWSNVMDNPYSNSEMDSNRFIGLSWNVRGQKHMQQLQGYKPQRVHLSALRSVWEPFAVLMQSPESSPQLKLVNCVFDGINFRDFCLNHQLIEVFKLRFGTCKATPIAWNNEAWKMLSKLRVLSLESSLIATEEFGNESLSPFMLSVTLNCPLIQELELTGRRVLETIKVEELSAISHCSKLRRLLLSNIMVENGNFLEDILKGCPLLESLRLKNVGNPEKCCYSSSLVTFLPMAKKLRTFCVMQQFMDLVDVLNLLTSLEECSLLSRVSLIIPMVFWKNASLFVSRFGDLCENLKQLVTLFCVMNVPDDGCHQSVILLDAGFREERPAFRVNLQTTNDRYGLSSFLGYPLSYFNGYYEQNHLSGDCRTIFIPQMPDNVLTEFESNVAIMPFGHHDSILHRLD